MISIKHKIIFIHIPKCAGQSIENIFLRDLGLSWKERYPLLLRPRKANEKGPERLAHLYAEEYFKFGYISKENMISFLNFQLLEIQLIGYYQKLIFKKFQKKIQKTFMELKV